MKLVGYSYFNCLFDSFSTLVRLLFIYGKKS